MALRYNKFTQEVCSPSKGLLMRKETNNFVNDFVRSFSNPINVYQLENCELEKFAAILFMESIESEDQDDFVFLMKEQLINFYKSQMQSLVEQREEEVSNEKNIESGLTQKYHKDNGESFWS